MGSDANLSNLVTDKEMLRLVELLKSEGGVPDKVLFDGVWYNLSSNGYVSGEGKFLVNVLKERKPK